MWVYCWPWYFWSESFFINRKKMMAIVIQTVNVDQFRCFLPNIFYHK